MKKCVFILLLMICGISKAQTVVFNETFTAGISNLWTRINVDGAICQTPLESYSSGWISVQNTENLADSVAGSASFFTTNIAANRWLISPPITLGAFGNYISWRAKSQDGSFPDAYLVLISTTGADIASFTDTLFNQAGETPTWDTIKKNLSTEGYDNQTIRVAFRHKSIDKYILYLDDIKVEKEDPVSINEMSLSHFTIYPNPTNGKLKVNTTDEILEIALIKLTGEKTILENSKQLDLSNLDAGIYFIQLTTIQGTAIRKFQKF